MVPFWVMFAVLSPGIQAVVNFTDKYILSSKIKDYRGFFMYGSILAFFIGIALWIFAGFPILTLKDTILVVLTGVFSIWGSVLYFRALQAENTSKIVFLIQMLPVFTLILSIIFLNEPLTSKQLLGFLLILFPSIIISNNGKFSFKLNKSFLLILIATIFWAFGQIFFKFVSNNNSFISLIGYETIGWTVGGLIIYLLFKQVRKSFISTTKSMNLSTLGLVFANESIYIIAKLVGFLAISLGPVALVSVLGGAQVFFAVLYGWVLTLIAPLIFKEDITKKGLFQKLIWGIVMIAGIFLIS